MHDGQLELQKPWLSSMSRAQVGCMVALEVLPLTLLLFPAGQAGIMAAVGMYGQVRRGGGGEGRGGEGRGGAGGGARGGWGGAGSGGGGRGWGG
mgnify:CR=1 FL=1